MLEKTTSDNHFVLEMIIALWHCGVATWNKEGKVLPECLFGCPVRKLWKLTMMLANDFSVCPWISAQESNEPRPQGKWFQCVPWRIDFFQLCSNCIGRLTHKERCQGWGNVEISLNYDVTVKWDNHTNPKHQKWNQSPLNPDCSRDDDPRKLGQSHIAHQDWQWSSLLSF